MEDHANEIMRLGASCGRWRSLQAQPRDGGSSWSDLHADVLYQVMCHLPSIHDCLSLAAVSRHWRGAVYLRLPCSLPKLCLALPCGRVFTFQAGDSSVLKFRKGLCRGSYCGATDRQLLSRTDICGVYKLVNPFSGREMLLPVPSGIRVHEDEPAPDEDYWSEEMPVRKLVVCPDGLVAAIVGHERSSKVALCKPELAWSWSLRTHDPWLWFADMAFFDGKLYALTNDGDLFALEVGHDDESGIPRISQVEHAIDGGSCHYPLQEYTRLRYLVVRPRSGDLLMVCRIMLECGSTTHEFAVFRADLGSSRWVQLYTLGGDEALFVGRLCSRVVRADRHGVPGDQIFFLDDSYGIEGPGLDLCDAFANVYDMKDGIVSEVLPMRSYGDVEVPATWLFREDADDEEE